MTIGVEVRSSGPGPRRADAWWDLYPESHPPLRNGRVLAYWIRCVAVAWPRGGVAVHIRKVES